MPPRCNFSRCHSQSQCGVFFSHRGPQIIIQGKWVLWSPILDIIFGTPLVEHTHSASQLVRHFDSCSCIRYFSSVIALPGPCQVTDLIAKEFSFMAVEQMCHGWSPLRGPIKGAAARWSKTQNQNDENWVADGGSNGRPHFFKLHLRLDDSSSS